MKLSILNSANLLSSRLFGLEFPFGSDENPGFLIIDLGYNSDHESIT